MRKYKTWSGIRPYLPVLVGLSLGFSMSLVRMPLNDKSCEHARNDHIDRQLRSIDSLNGNDKDNLLNGMKNMKKDQENPVEPIYDSFEDFEPRIITDPGLKPKIDMSKNKKKIERKRFISMELGIREKLYLATVTSEQNVHNLGIAVNKTAAHHLQKIEFFIGTNYGSVTPMKYPNNMAMQPVQGDSTTQVFKLTLTKIYDAYKDVYDWFFIAQDSVYINAERLNNLVNHISINKKLYMGRPITGKYQSQTITYCDLGSGILISRLLLIELGPQLYQCFNNIYSSDPSLILGYCIHQLYQGAVTCVDYIDDQTFSTFTAENGEIGTEQESSNELKNAITVGNMKKATEFYKVHEILSKYEVDLAYKEIEAIQEEIKLLANKIPDEKLSWPVGVNPQFKPTNRWDIIVWDYFTEDYTLSCPGEVPKCSLTGIDKLDVENILQIAMDRLNDRYKPEGVLLEKKKLINGYRRFDPQRGMEYILDLLLIVTVGDQGDVEISHRVNLLRPLSQVEIIPMPYVTESTRVEIILPIKAHERDDFDRFMENYAKVCLESNDNVDMSIVFIYDPDNAQRIHEDDIFGAIKRKLQEFEVKYQQHKPSANSKLIPWISIKTEVSSQLKIVDVIAKKRPAFSLFFLASLNAVLDAEFLNRCRMNSIQKWQAFFPIPFSQYNREIIFKDKPVPKDIEIKPIYGHFDSYSFDETCFYNSDYMAARTKLSSQGDSKSNSEDPMDTMDIYTLLVKYSELHIFRAVEPQLKRYYTQRHCDSRSGVNLFQKCERSNAEGLASRTQLAMELYPDDNDKKL